MARATPPADANRDVIPPADPTKPADPAVPPAAAPVAAKPRAVNLNDIVAQTKTQIVESFLEAARGAVDDLTNAEFQQIINNLTTDHVALGVLSASKGDDDEEVVEITARLSARRQSLLQVPGLVRAGRQQQLVNNFLRVGTLATGVVAGVVRSQLGLPPVVTA